VLREQRRRRVEPRGRGARLPVEPHGDPLDQADRAVAVGRSGWSVVVAWPAGVRGNGNGELGELAPCALSLCGGGGAAGPETATSSGRGGCGIGHRSGTRRGLFLGRRRGHGSPPAHCSAINQLTSGVCPCAVHGRRGRRRTGVSL
jgi:hypothetical protein